MVDSLRSWSRVSRRRGQRHTGHPAAARAGPGGRQVPADPSTVAANGGPRSGPRGPSVGGSPPVPSCQGGWSVQVGPGTPSLSPARGLDLTVSSRSPSPPSVSAHSPGFGRIKI